MQCSISARRFGAGLLTLAVASSQSAAAADCPADHDKLEKALKASVKPSGGPTNGGFDNNEWAALRDARRRRLRSCLQRQQAGRPMAGQPGDRGRKRPAQRMRVSLDGFALSTANLYAGAQPGGSLFGLALSAPPNPGGSLLRRSSEVRLRVGPVRRQVSRRA